MPEEDLKSFLKEELKRSPSAIIPWRSPRVTKLPAAERKAVIDKLVRFTGLDAHSHLEERRICAGTWRISRASAR